MLFFSVDKRKISACKGGRIKGGKERSHQQGARKLIRRDGRANTPKAARVNIWSKHGCRASERWEREARISRHARTWRNDALPFAACRARKWAGTCAKGAARKQVYKPAIRKGSPAVKGRECCMRRELQPLLCRRLTAPVRRDVWATRVHSYAYMNRYTNMRRAWGEAQRHSWKYTVRTQTRERSPHTDRKRERERERDMK